MNIDEVVGASLVMDNKNRKRWVATRTDIYPGESPDEHKTYYLNKKYNVIRWMGWDDEPRTFRTEGGAKRAGRSHQRWVERQSRREYYKRIRLV